MTARSSLDRFAAAVGATSVVSTVFVVLRGDFGFVRLRGWAVVVALALGALALLAGWTARRALTVVAGAGFLLAALAQVAVWATPDNWLGGNGSTVSLWLGLGVGLLAAGLAPQLWPDDERTGPTEVPEDNP